MPTKKKIGVLTTKIETPVNYCKPIRPSLLLYGKLGGLPSVVAAGMYAGGAMYLCFLTQPDNFLDTFFFLCYAFGMAYQSPFTDLRRQLHRQQEFLQNVLDDTVKMCIWGRKGLRWTTPGHYLPEQWISEVHVSGRRGTAHVWNVRVISDPDTWEPIMGYLNFGTRKHPIAPVNKQALHWIDEETGEDRFSMGHDVKGIKAAHFMEKAQKQVEQFTKTLQRRWENFLNAK